LTCDDPSKVGTLAEVEVSYRVLGAYASSGIAAGLNGKIPVALKPLFMFSTVIEFFQAFVNMRKN
jgi:hypothetical protein